ncbi:SGNH/GDSL hydrolase family protein [Sorangium sp. So ce128]|uniref:SGNH/GDSL hydrolase family protein n=1 Tax=Sorangium sp. So ce128 TaxID=3133281 RepID=UPI003F645D7A
MSSVVLLGDSIFDNGSYTNGEPDVASHLRALLPSWRVTLCAVDGTTTSDIGPQLDRMPKDATHVLLSLGGNDALSNADILGLPVRSTAEALDMFRERVDAFEQSYSWALEAVVALGRPATVCTIYNGNLAPGEAERARIALMTFNDVILRQAFSRALDVVDLRLVCSEVGDFANAIEPSGAGGLKIAQALVRALGAAAVQKRATTVTVG